MVNYQLDTIKNIIHKDELSIILNLSRKGYFKEMNDFEIIKFLSNIDLKLKIVKD